jgi:hypothetical protein
VTPGITNEQRRALELIAPIVPAGTYLAGGVAVALRCGHRTSLDLDLFTPHELDSQSLAERAASEVSGVRVLGTAPGTLELDVVGVPTSILRYRYPLLNPPEPFESLPIRIAAATDLVCMKLSALAARGAARDFWDLHVLIAMHCGSDSLARALSLYRQKYSNDDIGHVIRSLAYFADAEGAPLPRGLDAAHWLEIKSAFESWVRTLE